MLTRQARVSESFVGTWRAKALIDQLQYEDDAAINPQTLTRDVMVIFNGPAHHYVTPKFYSESKPATGKVVPT